MHDTFTVLYCWHCAGTLAIGAANNRQTLMVLRAIGVENKTHIRQCKMSSSKNIDLKRDFAAGVYMYEA